MTHEGLALVKRFEGFNPSDYICSTGWPTIGYGYVVRAYERERFADGIDEESVEDVLRYDG